MTSRNGTFVSVLVEALARSGVRHACVTPGSRNTPLSLAFAAHPSITDWSHHDERSSAFFALGLSRTLDEPVAVVTTSGTAVAELLPALVEAAASRVPLVVITADRPTELADVSAPQTIDQRGIFGRTVRWHHDLDVPDPTDAGPSVTAALGARLVAEAVSTPAGPTHLNVRFREPLLIEPDFDGIDVPTFFAAPAAPTRSTIEAILEQAAGRRGIVVCGPGRGHVHAGALTRMAEAIGWPILADPISGLRAGGHPVDRIVGSDLVAVTGILESLAPEAVLRFGAPPTSKALRTWMARSSVPQIVVDPAGWPDPDASGTVIVRAEAGMVAAAVAEVARGGAPGWAEAWVAADRSASNAASAAIDEAGFATEPGVVSALARAMPDGAALWAASSMPVRDVDAFFPVTERPLHLRANRGANGIDGLASTALGTAASGIPTIAHLGDLSMLHDVGALATAARLALPVTFLVVNNDGGGIFHFLPQAGHEHFERHFGTPHGLSFRAVADGFGLDAVLATDSTGLETAIAETASGPRLVEVRTDRHANVAVHREIIAAARAAAAVG